MLVVVSCGDRVPTWRRTELDLRSCKPFDNQHRPTTFGAKPSIARTGGGYLCLGLWCRAEQLKAKRQGRGTSAIGQEAEVTDADETLRKDMQQKTGQEFVDGQWQQPLFVGVSGVAPTKRDRSVSKRDQATVGDGHGNLAPLASREASGYFCYLNSRGTYCAELRAGLTRRWGSYENRSPLSKWLSLPAPWRMVRPIPPANLERGWLLQPQPRFQTFGALQRLSQYF